MYQTTKAEPQSVPVGNSFLHSQTLADQYRSQSQLEQQYRSMTQIDSVSFQNKALLDFQDFQETFTRITRDCLALDKISFQDPKLTKKNKKILLSFRDALDEFSLIKPSDDFLIKELKYLDRRRATIIENLKTEIDRIADLLKEMSENEGQIKTGDPTPQMIMIQDFYKRSKMGKFVQRHVKSVLTGDQLTPEVCLSIYVKANLAWLQDQQDILLVQCFGNDKRRTQSDLKNLLQSQNLVFLLGDTQQQNISNPIDEKIFLEKRKAEVFEFEVLVFKLNVVIERVNKYTTGVIFPRDQNLNIIPFFDTQQQAQNGIIDPRSVHQRQVQTQYDFQSCLKVISVTDAQITRLEAIEIHLGTKEPLNVNLNSSMMSQDSRQSYKNPDFDNIRRKFNVLRTEFKEKKTISPESQNALQTQLEKFTGSSQLDKSLQLMLHVQITNVMANFEQEGYRLEQQLYYMPKKPFSQIYRIEGCDSKLFTEINFFDHLVQNDFVMILKLYKEIKSNPIVNASETVIPGQKDVVYNRLYQAFAVVNLFDLIIEDHLKCDKPYKLNLVRFYEIQQAQCIDELYPAFCTAFRKGEVSDKDKFKYSQEITTSLKLRMQLTFLTLSNPSKLNLRIDQTLICRPKRFWEKMVRLPLKADKPEMNELLQNQKQELDDFNLKLIQQQNVYNYLRIDLRNLHLKEKAHRIQHIMRVQVFLYSSDSKESSKINIKFLQYFYRYPNEQENLDFFYQSNIAKLNIGRVEFYNQFYVKLPSKTSLKELEKLKLVYLIQFPSDSHKTIERITEEQITQEPSRFQFKTHYFAKQPLYDSTTGQFAGYSQDNQTGNSVELKVMECRLNKKRQSFIDIFESEQPVVKDLTLTVQMYLISQLYATQPEIRNLIELNQEVIYSSHQILEFVRNLQNNDILIYHQRLLDSLIYKFLNSAVDYLDESKQLQLSAISESQFIIQNADNIYLAIVIIIEKFNSKELKVYQTLIKDYQRNWCSVGRENDQKLFKAFEQKVENIKNQLVRQLQIQSDFQEEQTKNMTLYLTHLPTLLNFLFKLFSKEFEIQYAEIRQFINSKFKKWLPQDLCVYRPEIYDNNFAPKRTQTSRPNVLIRYLEEDIKKIKLKLQELLEKQKKEITANESDEGDVNFTAQALAGNESDFDYRISDYQQKRSTFRESNRGTQDLEIHIKKLDTIFTSLKSSFDSFSLKIKNCVLDICDELQKTPDFINQYKGDEDWLSNLFNFEKMIKLPLVIYYQKLQTLKEAFWRSLPDILQTMVNFIDSNFVCTLFDEQMLLSPIQPALPVLIKNVLPDFESQTDDNFTVLGKSKRDDEKYTVPFSTEQIELLQKQRNQAFSTDQTQKSMQVQMEIVKEEYNTKIKNCKAVLAELRQFEEIRIDNDILLRVTVLSDILSSDVFLLLPNETNFVTQSLQLQPESLHETLAASISKSVFNSYIKVFKNAIKNDEDTRKAEMTMYFLYNMNEFETKFYGSQQKNFTLVPPLESKLSILLPDEISFSQTDQSVMLNNSLVIDYQNTYQVKRQKTGSGWVELTKTDNLISPELVNNNLGDRYSNKDLPQIIYLSDEEEKEDKNEVEIQSLSKNPNKSHKSNYQQNVLTSLDQFGWKNKLNKSSYNLGKDNDKNANFMLESMKLGLGARQENNKEQDLLLLDFEDGKEKRLAYFLRETEEVFLCKKEIADGKSNLENLRRLSTKYQSLCDVQTIQHLWALNKYSFKQYYEVQARAGCLNRLVREVKLYKQALLFSEDDLFLMIKVLQVIERFCDYVIHLLCKDQTKHYIANLNDKYTYKSIVSQTWLLQLTLWAEEATQLFAFKKKMSLFFRNDSTIQKIGSTLHYRMQKHSDMQVFLWNTYQDMGDMILPENSNAILNSNAIYTGIQSKIKEILKGDLEDPVMETAVYLDVHDLLRPLAQIYAQIDELHYKCRKTLSASVLTNFERFIKEIIEIVEKGVLNLKDDETKNRQKVLKHALNEKRKRVCELFCELHCSAILQLRLIKDDPKFNELIMQRSQDFYQIKKLYLDVINYEQKKISDQQGNLLVQLVSFHSLMEILQERNLSNSFQSHIKLKYSTLIKNIQECLYQSFKKEEDYAKNHSEMICEKSEQLYKDQMKEVQAFMHVQDYITYKNAIKAGEMSTLGSKNQDQIIMIIDQATKALVNEDNKNQFFDVAIGLLSEKRTLLEKTYEFEKIQKVLEEQKQMYQAYERFDKRDNYCKYYRVSFEPLMPVELQQKDRIFIYRAPSGHNLDFIKDDIVSLLGHKRNTKTFEWEKVNDISIDKAFSAKVVKTLTTNIKQKYGVPKEMMELSEITADTADLNENGKEFFAKVEQYNLENFKKHFYIEEFVAAPIISQKGNDEYADFKAEYILTIYEVKQSFPTMTMIQTVKQPIYKSRISAVQYNLWDIQSIIREIQLIIRDDQTKSALLTNAQRATNLQYYVGKYITNDEVGGGLGKIVDQFFPKNLAQSFNELENLVIKRAYLELFKNLEMCGQELYLLVEQLELYSRDLSGTAQAKEKLDKRQNELIQKRKDFNLDKLQENF